MSAREGPAPEEKPSEGRAHSSASAKPQPVDHVVACCPSCGLLEHWKQPAIQAVGRCAQCGTRYRPAAYLLGRKLSKDELDQLNASADARRRAVADVMARPAQRGDIKDLDQRLAELVYSTKCLNVLVVVLVLVFLVYAFGALGGVPGCVPKVQIETKRPYW